MLLTVTTFFTGVGYFLAFEIICSACEVGIWDDLSYDSFFTVTVAIRRRYSFSFPHSYVFPYVIVTL